MSENSLEFARDYVYKNHENSIKTIESEINNIRGYDSATANFFEKRLNKIINSSKGTKYIISELFILKEAIDKYKGLSAERKIQEEQVKYIRSSIRRLKESSSQLSIKKCISEFSKILNDFEQIKKLEYDERSKIYSEIYELLFIFISRAVIENRKVNLKELIKDYDEVELEIYINKIIEELRNSENEDDRFKAQKLFFYKANNQDYIHSNEFWEIMNGLDGHIQIEDTTEKDESNGIPPVLTEKGPSIYDKAKNALRKTFKIEPSNPPSVDDIKKIDMKWLAKQDILNEMLEDMERDRLKTEGKEYEDIFVPDVRTPFYDLIEEYIELHNNGKDFSKTYRYVDINEKEKQVRLERVGENDYLVFEGEKTEFRAETKLVINEYILIEYALLLDKAFKTDFYRTLICDMELFFKTTKKITNKKYTYAYSCKIVKDLITSFNKLEKEYRKTNISFRTEQSRKRHQKYEQAKFKSELKKKIQGKDTDNGQETNNRLNDNNSLEGKESPDESSERT